MTAGTGNSLTPCVSAYTATSGSVLSNQGPSGQTWVFDIKMGLENNNNLQYADMYVNVIDHTPGEVVGHFGVKHYNWMATGDNSQGTITVEIGSTVDMNYYINNNDSQSECFYVNVNTYYY